MIIIKFLENIDTFRGTIVSVGSAVFGSVLNIATFEASVLSVTTDPNWFVVISPYLQCLAWITAVVVGGFTIRKLIKDNKK